MNWPVGIWGNCNLVISSWLVFLDVSSPLFAADLRECCIDGYLVHGFRGVCSDCLEWLRIRL